MRASLWTKLGVTAGVIAAVAACTVTSGNLDDGGLGTDGGTGADGAKADGAVGVDSGGKDANTCTLVVGINTPACTACLMGNCCAQVNTCFGPGPDGGTSDCSDLQSCITVCAQGAAMDAGGPDAAGQARTCIETCRAAHPNSVAAENAWVSCASASCMATCFP